MMKRVLGDALCDLDPKVKDKGQIMYFFVNTYPHKHLEVAISYLHVHRSHNVEGTRQHFM